MGHFRVVLIVLKKHQLFAKYSKCEFLLGSVVFHSHIIYSEGTDVDLKKINMVKNWPRLLTPTDIIHYLGLAGHYRRFVDGPLLLL